ncbi:hypothetical protein [Oceanococcus atlanticus]|nr:hypothetical protein [Oceanococcus atlanticus]
MKIRWGLRWMAIAALVLVVLLWPDGRWRPGAATPVGPTPAPLRIVCVGGEKFMRCPSDCEVDARGQAACRCQDFYYQRGNQPLTFSHSLCR